MAIRTNTQSSNTAQSSDPDTQVNTQVDETTEPETKADTKVDTQVDETPEQDPRPSNPPATRAQADTPSASTAGTGPGSVPFNKLRNILDPETYGNTFRRLVPSGGKIRTDNGIILGEYIDIQVVSISDRWMTTPVADLNKDPDAKKYCRASYDGVMIPDRDGGPSMKIEDWHQAANRIRTSQRPPQDPFDEWKLSKYLDVFGIIFNASDQYKETAINIGMVQVSVSTTAIKDFNAFFMQGVLEVMRGRMLADKQNCMRVTSQSKTNDRKQDYTILVPGLVPLEIVTTYTPIGVF